MPRRSLIVALFATVCWLAAPVAPALAAHGGGGGGHGGMSFSGASHMGNFSGSSHFSSGMSHSYNAGPSHFSSGNVQHNFSGNSGSFHSGSSQFYHNGQPGNVSHNFNASHLNNFNSVHHGQTFNHQFDHNVAHDWDHSFRNNNANHDFFAHHEHGHDHDFHHGWWGGYWPWYGLSLGLGYGWGGYGWGGYGWGYPYGGYAYSYYPDYASYPDYGGYYYSYAPVQYSVASVPIDSTLAGTPDVAVDSPVADSAGIPADMGQPAAPSQGGAEEALQYYNEARDSFQRGDYQNALRLAGHAGIEQPQNPKVHELMALGLFARGDFTGAASQAHLALILGPPSDWNSLFGYYGDVDKYTTQLRALEKFTEEKPADAAAHFLLGYQYLMTGANDRAKIEFGEAAKLTPKDKLARYILDKLNANAPVVPPPAPTAKQGGEPM